MHYARRPNFGALYHPPAPAAHGGGDTLAISFLKPPAVYGRGLGVGTGRTVHGRGLGVGTGPHNSYTAKYWLFSCDTIQMSRLPTRRLFPHSAGSTS